MNWYNRQLKIATKISNDDIKIMEQFVREGFLFSEIASMFDISYSTISSYNKRYRWRDLKKERSDRDNLIIDLYMLPPRGKGLSAWKLLQQYGFGYKTIIGALSRHGLFNFYRRLEDTNNSESQRQRYIDDTGLKDNLSKKQKQRYIDNPDLKNERSEFMIEYWKNYPGGWDAYLDKFPPEKQKQIKRMVNINSPLPV